MNELKAELQKLYADASKHSVYQNVPDFVAAELGYTETIDENWRGDRPRLAYMLETRSPAAGETWLDFGANTGFFALTLAHEFPQTRFVAVEANPNHAGFIERVSKYFGMGNVEVIQRAIGFADLHRLPHADCLLHLNVLHHAGYDFDADLVPVKNRFADYAQRYLRLLRERADEMFFQMGSNWGGDKNQPIVGVLEDVEKLETFAGWLTSAGWDVARVAYAARENPNHVRFENLPFFARGERLPNGRLCDAEMEQEIKRLRLDDFPGEFYRRPLFFCMAD